MARLNLILLAILVACALSVVTSQNKARKLYVELQKEQELAKQFDVEWGQLQLEQSTWAMHARIEKIASSRLQMHVPVTGSTRLVPSEGGYDVAGSDATAANGTRRRAQRIEPVRSVARR